MSTTTAKLSAYVKGHKLVTGCIVTGVVALIAIGGVMAWSNNTKTTDTAAKPAVTAAKESEEKKTEAAADKTETAATVTGETATASAANDIQNTGGAAQVQLSSADVPTTNNVIVAPVVPATPPVTTPETAPTNPGQGGGSNPGTGQPTNPTNPTNPTDPTNPTNPTDPTTPTDPTKFDKARVSLTFDDGWKSIHDNGLPLLQKYGLVSTQYINGQPTVGATNESWAGYMNGQNVKNFADAGHEIAWHTNTHTYDLTTANAEQRAAELTPNADFLSLLMNVNVQLSDNFAAPYGTQSAESAAAAKAAGFNSYRTTYDGYNTKGATDVMNIKVKNVCGIAGLDACNMQVTTPEEVATWIAEAQANKAWLVIVYHEVAGFNSDASATCEQNLTANLACDTSYAITPANLDAELALIAAAKANGSIEVQTVQQALSELRPQL